MLEYKHRKCPNHQDDNVSGNWVRIADKSLKDVPQTSAAETLQGK